MKEIFLFAGQSSQDFHILEKFFYANIQGLRKNSILYPLHGLRDWSHMGVYQDLTADPEFIPTYGTLESMLNSVSNWLDEDGDKVAIAVPALFGSYKGIMARLVNRLSVLGKVNVIVYLNHQIEVLKYYWLFERLRKGENMDFELWASWKTETKSYGLNYLRELRGIAKMVSVSSLNVFSVANCKVESEISSHALNQLSVTSMNDFEFFGAYEHNLDVQFDCSTEFFEFMKKRFSETNAKLGAEFGLAKSLELN